MGTVTGHMAIQMERLALLWLARSRVRRPIISAQARATYMDQSLKLLPWTLAVGCSFGWLLFQMLPGVLGSATLAATQVLWRAWVLGATPLLAGIAMAVVAREHVFSELNHRTRAGVFHHMEQLGHSVADFPGIGWVKAYAQAGLSSAVVLLTAPLLVGVVCAMAGAGSRSWYTLDSVMRTVSPMHLVASALGSSALCAATAIFYVLRYWPDTNQPHTADSSERAQ